MDEKIKEVYGKYKHLDVILSSQDELEAAYVADVIPIIWKAIKQHVESSQ